MRPAKIVVVAGMGLLLIAPSAAFASDIPAALTIRPGPLYLVSSAQGMTVVDATGSADGWKVLASITSGSGFITSIQAAMCGLASTCSLPSSDISYPEAIGSSPVTIAEALPGTGMGTIMTGLAWQVTGSVIVQIVAGP